MGFCKGRPDLQTGHCGDWASVCVIHLKLVGGGGGGGGGGGERDEKKKAREKGEERKGEKRETGSDY